jgi:hypothetical protein
MGRVGGLGCSVCFAGSALLAFTAQRMFLAIRSTAQINLARAKAWTLADLNLRTIGTWLTIDGEFEFLFPRGLKLRNLRRQGDEIEAEFNNEQ